MCKYLGPNTFSKHEYRTPSKEHYENGVSLREQNLYQPAKKFANTRALCANEEIR